MSRTSVRAGVLTLLAEHEDQKVVEKMVFDPTNVPLGIECSDDPLLAFRSEVYSASHEVVYKGNHTRREWQKLQHFLQNKC